MPTIFDVARAANVSIASVSLVLADPETNRVGAKKRAIILRLAREIGYKPSLLARGLRRHGTGILGLVVPTSNSKVFFNITISEILAGIQACLAERGCHLMVYSHPNGSGKISEAEIVQSKATDGLIVINTRRSTAVDISATIAELNDAAVPFVMINSAQDVEQINYVGTDDRAIAQEAGEYLIARGHKRIALIASTAGSPTSLVMKQGLKAALKAHRLKLDPKYLAYGALEREDTLSAVDRLLDVDPLPTAIVCGSDLMAPEIYERVRAKRLRVPDDISIVSRGDLMFARFLSPPLTTFCAPYFEIGYRSAKVLIDVLKDKKPGRERILLPAPLVERGSAITFSLR